VTFLVVGVTILIIALPQPFLIPNTTERTANADSFVHHHAGMLLPRNSTDPANVNYDEQIGETFTESFTSMAYNVTAVPQVDESGYGPAYLLNGLSNTDYWYQVGISYDWPSTTGGYYNGFAMIYEVFNPTGTSIYPITGSGGLQSFSGPVYSGDIVLLNLYFGTGSFAGDVVMLAYDYNTGAEAYETYSAEGGSYFAGNSQNSANAQGFFTGLMTEEYHANAYFGSEQLVSYFDYQYALSSAWQWIDEYNVNTNQSVFSASSGSPVVFSNYHQLHSFSSNGATEYSDACVLDTGADPVSLSLSATPVVSDVGTAAIASFSSTASGGTAPYTFLVYLDNNLVSTYTSASGFYSTSLNFGQLSGGSHTYYVDAIDSNGYPASSQSVSFSVNLDPLLTIQTAQLTADKGQNVPITYIPVFGTPPYSFTLYINGVAASQPNLDYASLQQLGQNSIYAVLTDAAGVTAKSNVLTVQVNPDPTVSVNQTSSVTDVGLPVSFTESTVNGTAPYSVTWFVNGLEAQNSGTSFRFVPNSTGIFSVYAQVIDGVGYVVNSTTSSLVVNKDPAILSFSSAGQSTNFFLTNNTALSRVSVSGGTTPLTYSWYLNGQKVTQTNSHSYTYTFSSMGQNTLQVNVSDAVGYTVVSSVATVNYSYDYLHIGMVIALAAIAALIVFFLTSRRKGQNRGPSSTSPPSEKTVPNPEPLTASNPTPPPISPQDPIELLKIRYAKGEITREQFEEVLRVLESTGKRE